MASVQELSSRYGTQLRQLKSIFPEWDEGDLAFTLQDTKGNVDEAAMMITEGRASQFTEATTKKKASKAPTKDTTSKHSNRNADTGGWENSNGEGFAGRGGRGGARGGRGGGRGGRGGEPTRGGRGGRGGMRGGRGGYAGINGTPKQTTETTDTTTDGWAAAVEEATSGQNGEQGQEQAESSTQAAAAGKGDDFAAAGGWGDAPSATEISKAAKSGNSGWQGKGKQAVSQINTAAPAPTGPPKLTWAQIAKPQEKPKPVPPPAPEVEEPAAAEETPAPEPEQEEAAAEPIESFGDAPAASEIEEQAAALPETEAEPETTAPQSDELLPEEETTHEEEYEDPAIAGSGGTGNAPAWVKDAQEQPKAEAPEPVTTYTGPPGFNSPTATKGPVAQVQAQAPPAQPRSNSRAAQRYKNADGKGVVLPNAVNSTLGGMELQFGSLQFGGENGDGADAPPAPASPVKATAPVADSPAATKMASPQFTRQPDPPLPAAVQQYMAMHAQQQAQQEAQQQTQQAPAGYPSAPSQQQYQQSQQSQQPQQSQQVPPHVTLQQQATNFNQNYQQQQHHQPQQQQNDPAVSQSQYYRQGGNDFYGSQSQEPAQQSQPQQQQPSSASAYDSAFGGFGQQSQQQVYGQGQQQHHQHQQPSQANDVYSGGRQAYDSYAASGYPRPAEEQKPVAPAPTHTPTAPGQQQPQQGLQQQNQYYQGLGNMGYYQAGPYNPYYQYGQAPQHGFQQYYPLAGRNLYGQPTPPAAPAPIPQSKPAQTQSPYGGPHTQPYPSSGYDDQTSFGSAGVGGRFGDSKAPSSAQSNQNQYSHGGFLGVGQQNAQSARQQAATPDDGFKSTTPQSSVGAAPGGQGQQGQQGQVGQGLRGPQGFGAAAGATAGGAAGGYPYGGYQAQGQQDWSPYGQQYGGSRNGGYSGWPQ